MSLDELATLVREWGRKHHITNPMTQYVKVIEEAGEIAHELTRGHMDTPELEDAIGDTLVTLIILADILKIDLTGALKEAYLTIAPREGKTINGNFIKGETYAEEKQS